MASQIVVGENIAFTELGEGILSCFDNLYVW